MTFRQFTPSIYGIMCIEDNSSRTKKRRKHSTDVVSTFIQLVMFEMEFCLYFLSYFRYVCVGIFILTKQKVFHFLRIFARHWNLEWHKCVQPYTTLCVCVCVFITEKLLKRPTFCCVTTLRFMSVTYWLAAEPLIVMQP